MSGRREARPLAALAVAMLLATAGCSAISGPGGGTDAGAGATPTLTPVPVDTDEGTAAAATPVDAEAPIVTQIGPDRMVDPFAEPIRDPFALANAHRDALADRSYRRIRTERIEGPNGTLWNATSRTRVAANQTRVLLEKDVESASSYLVDVYRKDLAIYHDGDDSYLRGTVSGELSYARVGGTNVLDDLSERDRLLALYGAFRFRVRTTGETYQLLGVDLTDRSALDRPPLIERPRNVTLVVNLTEDGRVRSYRLAYDASFEDRRVRVVRSVRFVDVGTATVPEPDWYAEAVAATDG